MEDQLKNTAQRRAVQLLSKDIQYIPIQNNINNNNDNNITIIVMEETIIIKLQHSRLQTTCNTLQA